ncbi:MAG: hypothetical protein ACRBEE_13535 [Arenicella sp.]
MKTLSKLLIASSVAAFFSTNALAADNDTHLTGEVKAVCEAKVLKDLDFGQDGITAGAMLNTPVKIRCNDADGATVKLISSEGGLESDDNEDFSVEYTADLTEGASGLNISLTTSPGVGLNDEFEEQTLPGSLALAGGVDADLKVTVNDSPVFAGGYSDTLTVTIAAN